MSSDRRVPPPFVASLTAAEYANASRSTTGRRGYLGHRWVDNFVSSPESLQFLQPRTLAPGEIIYLPPPPAKHQGSVPILSEAAGARAAQIVNPGVVNIGGTPTETVRNRAHPLTETSLQTVQSAKLAGRTPAETDLHVGKPMNVVTTNVAKIHDDDDDDDVVIIGETRGIPRFPTIPVRAGAASAPNPVADAVPAPSSIRKRRMERVVDSGRMKQAKTESYNQAGTVSRFVEIIVVDVGEDISDAVRKYSLKRQHNVCILGANGTISKAVLRVPQEARPRVLEEELIIISMQGLFVYPVPGGREDDRAGGMSMSVSSSTRVFGGVIAGSIIASSKVQVSVMSFTPSGPTKQLEA